ncbi:dihydropteroate synthase [Anaeroselena agilis]|uniref:Dihydropteroate synthase n=1 Tax=Anaeroselena agilis TaxID=3063788 RepID=A0ABU3NWT3_9FIRM|nr:dihydropteroate synthase [Selenomonadales bacterium 4137-cl]
MNFNPRLLRLESEDSARTELAGLGCDPVGVNIMSAKAVFKIVRLDKVPAKAANLLKQTFLAKGGEVALARGTADLSVAESDVLICATLKQYRLALAQLKLQPWGLPKVAAAVERALAAEEAFPARRYEWPGRELVIRPGRTVVMGILNVTPDSFSDGGRYNRIDAALRHAEAMAADGADVIDIGAESTRPYGATEVDAEEEMERLLPVVERVLAASPLPVSVDTYKASVAEAALRLGAHIVNDVWGLQRDAAMAKVCARYGAPVVVMHNQAGTQYEGDVMAAVCDFLRRSVVLAAEAGVAAEKVIVDPGIGFGKTPIHNLQVLNRLDELKALGCPVLLGTSRKRFIGEALGGLPPGDRVAGTAATVACGIMRGAQIVRVHDVREMARVARVTDAIMEEMMPNG